jgi:hypothetical protein
MVFDDTAGAASTTTTHCRVELTGEPQPMPAPTTAPFAINCGEVPDGNVSVANQQDTADRPA